MTWLTVLNERTPQPNSEYARLIKGSYGKAYELDEDGNPIVQKIKRSRGRPKKLEGINFEYTKEMMRLETMWSGIDIEWFKKNKVN